MRSQFLALVLILFFTQMLTACGNKPVQLELPEPESTTIGTTITTENEGQ
jgi:predicted small lipoprotein YifL